MLPPTYHVANGHLWKIWKHVLIAAHTAGDVPFIVKLKTNRKAVFTDWNVRRKRDNYYNRPSKYPSRIVVYPMSCGLLSFVDGYEGQAQDFQAFRARA